MRVLHLSKRMVPGGYLVQYTDAARADKEALEEDVREMVEHQMQTVAAVSPHVHGETVLNIRDRRRVEAGPVAVTFWVSEEPGVLTVVDISPGTQESEIPESDADPADDSPTEEDASVEEAAPATEKEEAVEPVPV